MGANFEIVVDSNAGGVQDAIRELIDRQISFATAVALTRVAQDARDKIRAEMPKHFTLRNKRVLRGVTIERARKQDWPHCAAKVGTLDEFMVMQITGGEKRPRRGAAHIAVPTRLVEARRTSSGKVRDADKPKQLLKRKDVVKTEHAITKRLAGKRIEGTKLANLQGVGRFFSLVPKATIPKRWPFEKEALESAKAGYKGHFDRELATAIKSARVREGKFSTAAGRAAYLTARSALI